MSIGMASKAEKEAKERHFGKRWSRRKSGGEKK